MFKVLFLLVEVHRQKFSCAPFTYKHCCSLFGKPRIACWRCGAPLEYSGSHYLFCSSSRSD